jgi:hypothetical protein
MRCEPLADVHADPASDQLNDALEEYEPDYEGYEPEYEELVVWERAERRDLAERYVDGLGQMPGHLEAEMLEALEDALRGIDVIQHRHEADFDHDGTIVGVSAEPTPEASAVMSAVRDRIWRRRRERTPCARGHRLRGTQSRARARPRARRERRHVARSTSSSDSGDSGEGEPAESDRSAGVALHRLGGAA